LFQTVYEIKIGSKISVKVDGKKRNFEIVNVKMDLLDDSLVSVYSPLGKKLLGRMEGDEFSFKVFDGSEVRVKILKVF